MFCNNFFHKNIAGESKAPCLFQKKKRRSAKSYFSKVLFPGNVYRIDKYNILVIWKEWKMVVVLSEDGSQYFTNYLK